MKAAKKSNQGMTALNKGKPTDRLELDTLLQGKQGGTIAWKILEQYLGFSRN